MFGIWYASLAVSIILKHFFNDSFHFLFYFSVDGRFWEEERRASQLPLASDNKEHLTRRILPQTQLSVSLSRTLITIASS